MHRAFAPHGPETRAPSLIPVGKGRRCGQSSFCAADIHAHSLRPQVNGRFACWHPCDMFRRSCRPLLRKCDRACAVSCFSASRGPAHASSAAIAASRSAPIRGGAALITHRRLSRISKDFQGVVPRSSRNRHAAPTAPHRAPWPGQTPALRAPYGSDRRELLPRPKAPGPRPLPDFPSSFETFSVRATRFSSRRGWSESAGPRPPPASPNALQNLWNCPSLPTARIRCPSAQGKTS